MLFLHYLLWTLSTASVIAATVIWVHAFMTHFLTSGDDFWNFSGRVRRIYRQTVVVLLPTLILAWYGLCVFAPFTVSFGG